MARSSSDNPYNPADYPPFAVTVDLVILTIRDGELWCLARKRDQAPFKGKLALPGGFVQQAEGLEDAAVRELRAKTGIESEHLIHLEQLGTYGAPKRDPRMRVVSVAYLAFAANLRNPETTAERSKTHWLPLDELGSKPLAFDHNKVLEDGLERARSKIEYTTLATTFCPSEFTIGELRDVYQLVWGQTIDPRNFHRKVLASEGFVIATEGKTNRGGGRPARLFKAGTARDLHPPLVR